MNRRFAELLSQSLITVILIVYGSYGVMSVFIAMKVDDDATRLYLSGFLFFIAAFFSTMSVVRKVQRVFSPILFCLAFGVSLAVMALAAALVIDSPSWGTILLASPMLLASLCTIFTILFFRPGYDEFHCGECGYEIGKSDSLTCPECGWREEVGEA